MTKRKDGFLLICKEKDISSHAALYPIKRTFNTKVGHTGTLDPMATGMIVCAVGKARKYIQFAQTKARKYYRACIQLGISTNTGDITGTQTAQQPVPNLNIDIIHRTMQTQFTGPQQQIPPIYSALKHQGKPYYTYARKGKEIPITARDVEIFNIDNIHYDIETQRITFDALVSAGTYIRTLAEDIGKALGTLGCLQALERVYAEPWTAHTCHTCEAVVECAEPDSLLIPIEDSLTHLKKITLPATTTLALQHGRKIKLPEDYNTIANHSVRVFSTDGTFMGVAKTTTSEIHPLKMLQES